MLKLLQLVSHHGTDSMRDLGLISRNTMLRPVGIVVESMTPAMCS